MGTSYSLYEDDRVEVSLDEMSNRLSLALFNKSNEDLIFTKDLETEEVLHMLMKGITAVSYWMDKEEFDKIFSKLETYPY